MSLSRHVRGKYPNFPWDLHLNCIAAHMDNFFLRSPSFLLAFYEAVYHKSSLYYCPKYKCVFSVFFILEGFLIWEKMQQHRFFGGFSCLFGTLWDTLYRVYMCYPSKYSSCIPSCLLPYPNFSHGFVARILWGSSIGGPKNDPLGLQNHQNYPKKSFSFNHSKWEYRWIHCVYIGNIEYRFIVFGRWRQAILSTCRFFNLALEKKETDSSFFLRFCCWLQLGL